MKIGIDFDRTLFDTDSFKQHLEQHFPEFADTYERAKENGVYRPRKHAEILGVELEDIFQEMQNCKKFVYDDIDDLRKLEDDGHDLFLISRGDEELQRLKIKGSEVGRYFQDIIIISEDIEKVPKDAVIDIDILADDRDKELEAVGVNTVKTDPESLSISDTVEKIREAADEPKTV